MIKKILTITSIIIICLLALSSCDAFADRTKIIKYMQDSNEKQGAIVENNDPDSDIDQNGANSDVDSEDDTENDENVDEQDESGLQNSDSDENTDTNADNNSDDVNNDKTDIVEDNDKNDEEQGNVENIGSDIPTILSDASAISGQYVLYIALEYRCGIEIFNNGKVQADANLKQTFFNIYEMTGTDKISRYYVKIGNEFREIFIIQNDKAAILDATAKEYEDFIVYAESQVKCSECGNVLNEQGCTHKETCSKYAILPVNSPASPIISGFGGVIENVKITAITDANESWSVELNYLTATQKEGIVTLLDSPQWTCTSLNLKNGVQYISSRKVIGEKVVTLDVTFGSSDSYCKAIIAVTVVAI